MEQLTHDDHCIDGGSTNQISRYCDRINKIWQYNGHGDVKYKSVITEKRTTIEQSKILFWEWCKMHI